MAKLKAPDIQLFFSRTSFGCRKYFQRPKNYFSLSVYQGLFLEMRDFISVIFEEFKNSKSFSRSTGTFSGTKF